jgi:hypothetical protein
MGDVQVFDTALTSVYAAGNELCEVLSAIRSSCDNEATQADWLCKSVASTLSLISAYEVFHALALGDNILTSSTDAHQQVGELHEEEDVVSSVRTGATFFDLRLTLNTRYGLGPSTAITKALELSDALSTHLAETMDAVKRHVALEDPIRSRVNKSRMRWVNAVTAASRNRPPGSKDFSVIEGSLAFPTELADPLGLIAPDPSLRARLEEANQRALSKSTEPTYNGA